MAEYYSTRPPVAPTSAITSDPDSSTNLSKFDKHRETLLYNDVEDGWVPELHCYLETMQHDIKKDSDIVEWCQVSGFTLKIQS